MMFQKIAKHRANDASHTPMGGWCVQNLWGGWVVSQGLFLFSKSRHFLDFPYHEFYKINVAVIVCIIDPKHVFLHLVCIIPLWQSLEKVLMRKKTKFKNSNLFHHFAKIFLLHLAIWVFSNEGIELFTDILNGKGK